MALRIPQQVTVFFLFFFLPLPAYAPALHRIGVGVVSTTDLRSGPCPQPLFAERRETGESRSTPTLIKERYKQSGERRGRIKFAARQSAPPSKIYRASNVRGAAGFAYTSN